MEAKAQSYPGDAEPGTGHLVVLVYGLWGYSHHLKYIADSLKAKHSDLHILNLKSNEGLLTHDGIDIGAERVTFEIEVELRRLEKDRNPVGKLSFVGYSMGGLVSRYAIGLLYAKGWFEKLECVNFTTFATPHLGCLTPQPGLHKWFWNSFVAHTLGSTGLQFFTKDSFRQTQRPILAVLADENSIFVKGLRQFKHRSLYGNIVNDSISWFTAGISAIDPFLELDLVKLNYVEGYEGVIVDIDDPIAERYPDSGFQTWRSISPYLQGLVLIILSPIVVLASLVLGSLAFFENWRSNRRVRLQDGLAWQEPLSSYRIPLISPSDQLTTAQHRLSAGTQPQEEPQIDGDETVSSTSADGSMLPLMPPLFTPKPKPSNSSFPTLPLTAYQFEMIRVLDDVGFKKYPVHISKTSNAHEAIVVRRQWSSFDDGREAVKHFVQKSFVV